MLKTLLSITLLGSLFFVSASQLSIDALINTSNKDKSENSTISRLDETTTDVSSKELSEKTTKRNIEKSTMTPTEKISSNTTEKSKMKYTDSDIEKNMDRTTESSIKNTTDKHVKKVTEASTDKTPQNYSHKTTANPTRSSTKKSNGAEHQSNSERNSDEFGNNSGSDETTTDVSSEEFTERFTENTTKRNIEKSTMKPTTKKSSNTTENTTKKLTDSHTEKVTDRITKDPTKNTTDKSIQKVTEASTDKTQQNHSHKTTENPTRSSAGKPHSAAHQSTSEENGDEFGSMSGSDENTSDISSEKFTEKTTKRNILKSTLKPTEKTSSNTTDKTTDKPVRKVTEASPCKKRQNHLHKTTENPTTSSTVKPHSAEYRKRCAKNEKYEHYPNKVREPQTCEHLGFQYEEDDDDEDDDDDDGSDEGACICVKGYVRNQRGFCTPVEKCPSCGGDKNATSGCGINCGRHCSDYEKEVQCLEVCYVNQCDCRDNFVLDEFTGKCVLPQDCSRKNPGKSNNSCTDGGTCSNSANNDKHNRCKNDSNEEDGSTESNCDEDDKEGNCYGNSNNTGISITTSEPSSSSSKCFDEAITLFVQATFAFSGKLLKELMSLKPTENVMATTLLVLNNLAQVGISANGDAYKQVMAALNFNNEELIKCFFKRILPIVRNFKSVEYKQIGKMYSDSLCPLTRDFRKQTKDIFTFEPDNLDFQNPKSAKIISQEVAEQTKGRIVDFIKPGLLSTLSGLVLISAAYFEGQWQKQFDPLQTSQSNFYVPNGKTSQVPTMNQKGNFLYTENSQLNAKILEMKYVGDNFSLAIVLPNRIDGLRAIVDRMRNPDVIMSALDKLKMETVEIYLPTFNMTVANRLKVPIERVNVSKIFYNKTAGLEDITPCNGTYVSDILQKATLRVDEFGAGTSKTTDFDTEQSIPEEYNRRSYIFKADHPFIYFVLYKKYIVFFGAYLH